MAVKDSNKLNDATAEKQPGSVESTFFFYIFLLFYFYFLRDVICHSAGKFFRYRPHLSLGCAMFHQIGTLEESFGRKLSLIGCRPLLADIQRSAGGLEKRNLTTQS